MYTSEDHVSFVFSYENFKYQNVFVVKKCINKTKKLKIKMSTHLLVTGVKERKFASAFLLIRYVYLLLSDEYTN